jgi:cytochrome P450
MAGSGKNAPGPRGLPLLGSLIPLVRAPLQTLLDIRQTYGDVASIRSGPSTQVMISGPSGIKHVLIDNYQNYVKGPSYDGAKFFMGRGLLTNEGAEWAQRRKASQPSFQRDQVMSYAGGFADGTAETLTRWRTLKEGEPIVIYKEMAELVLRLLCRNLFQSKLKNFEPLIDAVENLLRFGVDYVLLPIRIPLSIPTPGTIRFRKAHRALEDFTLQLVRERPNRDPQASDLLSLLTAKGVDERQVRDEIATFIIAGFETTAITLTWILYVLSQHPDAERRLYEEASAVLGDRKPTAADVSKLTYTTMVVHEVLRLYPPLWTLERTALEDDEVAGYRIPKGEGVVICPYVIHRNPRYWERPEEFDPERFSPERFHAIERFTYVPFLVGPRQCIGNYFAMAEIPLIIAMIAREFRLQPVSGHSARPQALLSLRPPNGMKMFLRRR